METDKEPENTIYYYCRGFGTPVKSLTVIGLYRAYLIIKHFKGLSKHYVNIFILKKVLYVKIYAKIRLGFCWQIFFSNVYSYDYVYSNEDGKMLK